MSIDNYDKMCKEYKEDSLYLLISATDTKDEIITYKIPLSIDSCE